MSFSYKVIGNTAIAWIKHGLSALLKHMKGFYERSLSCLDRFETAQCCTCITAANLYSLLVILKQTSALV